MRNLKKFLALVLAMMMAFSLMITVNAATTSDFTDKDAITKEFAEDIEVLRGMGVFEGYEDGTFLPKNSITRAEVATIVYRIATDDPEGKQAHLYKDYAKFDDVKSDHWAAGYINFCANAEWIAGYGNGKFGPNDQVTGYQAAAMILRAVGYGKNGEFQGSGWQVQVANVTRTQGLLANVDKTTYANTLNQVANRELVGEILFQAANIPTVTWTMLGGYNKYTTPLGTEKDENGDPALNPSLGYINYGLKSATRVILGNQATGEGGTLLGNTTKTYKDANGQTQSLDVSYVYPGSVIATADVGDVAAADKVPVGNGLKVDAKTGLDMFGHKVTVWYNETSTATWKPTYAVFDRATLTATVQAMVAANNDADVILSDGTTPANAKLGMAAQKAGFTVDLETSKAWVSDRYGRIMGCKAAAGTVDVPAAGAPKSTKAVDTNDGIYALISNNSGKTVDVIVSLEGEVGIIAQKDTTATVKTLTVGGTDKAITNKSSFEGTAPGIFAINSLTEGSTQVLGDKVTAWQIQGTNNADVYDTYAEATGNVGTHTNGNDGTDKYFRYELEKLETTVSGTVRTYGTNHEITMTDGTTYKQSWFRWLPTGGRGTDAVIGTNDTTEPFIVPAPFQAGVTYTIALDKFGNWLGAVPARDQFIYGTFGDYGFGDLGSGSIQYTLTGVNWNGEKVINHKIVSMNLDGDDYFDGNLVEDQQLADGYGDNDLYPITKKILGTTDAGTGLGNRIYSGKDTGFVVSEDGALTDVYTGYANLANADGVAWTIGKSDVANGFADLSGDGKTLATSKTQFIVVTGTGTDTLDVKIYNGMAEFLGSSSWVSINCDDNDSASFTYYLTEADLYNRYNTEDNKQVAKVIVDARDVTWTGASNVYYLAKDKTVVSDLKLAGNPDDANIKPYEMWNNGVKSIYWIDIEATRVAAGIGSPSEGEKAAMTGDDNTAAFYNLVQINTVHGTPIYKAVKAVAAPTKGDQPKLETVANGGVCRVANGLTYEYIGASELNTGRIGGETLNVSNAVVADVEWNAALTRTEIKSVADINAAISAGYTVKVAIVNDGVNVNTIYVISATL